MNLVQVTTTQSWEQAQVYRLSVHLTHVDFVRTAFTYHYLRNKTHLRRAVCLVAV